MTACTIPTQIQNRQNPSTKMGNGHKVPTLTKKLFAVDVCKERKNPVAVTGHINHIPVMCPRIVDQHKMDFMFVCFSFGFDIFVLFLFSACFYFHFLFYFSFLRKRERQRQRESEHEHEVEWVMKSGD